MNCDLCFDGIAVVVSLGDNLCELCETRSLARRNRLRQQDGLPCIVTTQTCDFCEDKASHFCDVFLCERHKPKRYSDKRAY